VNNMNIAGHAAAAAAAGLARASGLVEEVDGPFFTYGVECIGADGQVKWREDFRNLVTTEGKNHLLTSYFKTAFTPGWFLGLKGTGTAAAGDTAVSHAGWAEVNPYSGTRPAISFGTAASGSLTATAVAYTINATATVAGAFVQSVNTGTTGTLYSAGDFSASRSVVSGDTLNVTLTVSV
jgi:hypothetical protein